MTIATTVTKVGYTGDGVTVAFSVPFPFFDNDELEVIERVIATGAETVKTLTTHYTVAGGNGNTGTVTALVAPANTVQWHIRRKTALVQEIDYPENDPFPAASHELGLDRGIAIDQEQVEVLDRALKIPITDATSINTTLPSSIERRGKILIFDSVTGEPGLGTPQVVDSTSLTVIQGTDPGHAEGRLWIDTSAAPVWRFKLSKGGSWITINEMNTTNTPWFNGAVLGALAALGAGDGNEIAAGLLRSKLDNTYGINLLERSSNGLRGRLAKGEVFGFNTANNATDANNDIDISPGYCRSDDDTTDIYLETTLTKRLDALFAQGTNQGGRDTGTKDAGSTYWIYVIWGSGVPVDAIFSKSLSPTLPASYTKKQCIGGINTNGSANIIPYIQVGNRWYRPIASQTIDLDVAIVAAGTYQHAGVSLPIPTGRKIQAIFKAYFRRTAGTTNAIINFGDDAFGTMPNVTTGPLPDGITTSTADAHAAEHTKFTTSAGYMPIYVMGAGGSDINAVLRLSATGWIHERGQI